MAINQRRVVHRSSETGKFVKEEYARRHRSTTEREVVKVPQRKDK